MVKKRNGPRKPSRNTSFKKRIVRITSNPFLNFFLSVCKVKGNQEVEKVARNAAVEWRKMNYLDKTPYYLLADEAKKRKKKQPPKKKEYEMRYSDWDSPLNVVPRRNFYNQAGPIKSDSELDDKVMKQRKLQSRRKSEMVKRKRSASPSDSDSVLTSDVEEIQNILETSERDLKKRRFWTETPSETSFGLTTSNTGSLEVMSSVSSITLEDTGKSLRKSHFD